MRVLAIDTAMASCSAALSENGIVLAAQTEVMQRGHSEALMPMISGLIEQTALTMNALDLIAVTRGPGAFTGLRIGLSAARGLAVALDIPCLGMITTQVIGENTPEINGMCSLLVALDTKRGDYYLQGFKPNEQGSTLPIALAPDGITGWLTEQGLLSEKIIVVGDVTPAVIERLGQNGIEAVASSGSSTPDAGYMAVLAETLWAESTQDFPPPAPLYLRPPDATLPKNGGRLRP